MEEVVNIAEVVESRRLDKIAHHHIEQQLDLIQASILQVSRGGNKIKAALMQNYLALYEVDKNEERRAMLINSALAIAVDGLCNLIGTELSKKQLEPRIVVSKLLQILGEDG